MDLFVIYLLSGLLFLFLLISLGFQPQLLTRILGGILLFVALGGIGFYGFGYYSLYGGSLMSVMRTLFSVFCMFLGRNEISAISQVEQLKTPVCQIGIYLVHLLALYATASTVVAGVGARLLRTLNLLLLYHKRILLLYGVSENTLLFAERLKEREEGTLVFVDAGDAAGYDNRIMHMGGLLLSDGGAVQPGLPFLQRIGMRPGRKALQVYCLHENTVKNLRYAESLRSALEKAAIHPSQTTLTLLTEDAAVGSGLQTDSSSGDYGYGEVLALDPSELAARLMVRAYPPCDTMRFGEAGRADENFEAMIVGFGRTGQSVLRSLVMNGQFEGSDFHALIIDSRYSQVSGAFFSAYPGLSDSYRLDFMEENARSISVYRYLKDYVKQLNYVVICTGDDSENAEIAREYDDFLRRRGSRAIVLQCSGAGVTYFAKPDGLPEVIDPYRPEVLCVGRQDRLAMLINHQYCLSQSRTLEEDWADCDYFSRMSCRASADYACAFLKAAGISQEELREHGWPDDEELMENLARMEHLRWCAFHIAMGYRPMPAEMFEQRARERARQVAETGSSSLRPGKDTENRLHVCLIPWEDLDALSEREGALTDRHPDYKQMDRDNLLMIPVLYREQQEGGNQA